MIQKETEKRLNGSLQTITHILVSVDLGITSRSVFKPTESIGINLKTVGILFKFSVSPLKKKLFLFSCCYFYKESQKAHPNASSYSQTWICEAWRSMVMMWSAPATESMFATSLADIGARL